MNVPEADGVPVIVITSDDQEALTPDGNPVAEPIPVAPVVAWVMSVNAVLIHNVGVLDAEPTVLSAVPFIVPVALTLPHPPVNGIV